MPVWECWIRRETKASDVKLYNCGIIGVYDKEEDAKSEKEKDKPWPGEDVKWECWIRKRTKAMCVRIEDGEIIGIYGKKDDAESEKATGTKVRTLEGKRKYKFECTIRDRTAAKDLKYREGGIIGVFDNQRRAEAELEKDKPWQRKDGKWGCWIRRKSKAFNVFKYQPKGDKRNGIVGEYHSREDAENEYVESLWPKYIDVAQFNKAQVKAPKPETVKLEKVFVVSRIGDEVPSDDNKIFPPEGHGCPCVDVFAVVKAKSEYYLGYDETSCLPTEARIGNSKVKLKRWDWRKWGKLKITWHQILPYMKHRDPDLRNKAVNERRSHEGEYEYTNVWADGPNEGKWVGFDTLEYKSIDLRSEWTTNVDTSVGTTRYQVDVKYGKQEISSPGKIDESTPHNLKKEDYDRGIKPNVHRISIRSHDPNKFMGYIEAYKKVPWIFGSSYLVKGNSKKHQTELFIGFDCADLMVGAARHGKITSTNYTGANDLAKNITRPVGDWGVLYMDGDGKIRRAKDDAEVSIPFGTGVNAAQIGDFIFFDWLRNWKETKKGRIVIKPPNYDHTTVIYSNENTPIQRRSRLDQETQLIMATHDGVATEEDEVPLTLAGEARGKGARFVLRRWKMSKPIYVLLSGFEPWSTYRYNSSKIVAKLAGRAMEVGGKSVVIGSIVIPVHWYDAADRLIKEIKLGHPDIVLGFGMKPENGDPKDSMFEIEPITHNQNDINEVDARGLNPSQVINNRSPKINARFHTTNPEKVKDNGPNVLPTKPKQPTLLPYDEIAKAINEAFPDFAFVDNDGTSEYICNQINYNLLYYNDKSAGKDRFKQKVMAGFIHVPELSELHDRDYRSWEEKLIKTFKIIVKVCAKKYV